MRNTVVIKDGRRFGRWTSIGPTGMVADSTQRIECVCDCGTVRCVRRSSLFSGESRSCGCLTRERSARRIPIDVRFWKYVKKTELCWLWVGATDRHGYGLIGRGGSSGNALASRVSWNIHFGEIPDGLNVLHRCDNPPCVRPDDLFLGTHADNTRDMMNKGRSPVIGNPVACRAAAMKRWHG